MKEDRKKELILFSNSLGLNIKDIKLLNTALTHGSYVKENSKKKLLDNERLEFFGDAVLKLYVSEYIMQKYPDYAEGQLSKLRAFVVSEKVLTHVANKLNLKKYLLMGKNEKKSPPVSIIADSVEALLAVIYYECGSKITKDFILDNWGCYIELADKDKEKDNFKASLQEHTQGQKLGLPVYKTIVETGPDHIKEFEVAVLLNNNELARGKGKTKKEASQDAARNAMIFLKSNQKESYVNIKV
jgi:ribonuclease-3